jgi:phosphate-selective porin OprO and OprP
MAGAVLATLPFSVMAEDQEAATRIQQLEKMMQQMQQQREEQDKQIQVMADELKAMQQQMAQTKESKVAEKGKSEGNPVYAAFKDGLVFEDGTGNWKLQMNGRVQADYRFLGNDEWSSTSSQSTTSPYAVSKGSWDSFSIRRARLGATFTFLKDYAVRVEGEYSNEAVGNKANTALTYAYLDINKWKQARIRMGQFKPFFGLERSESTNFTDFAELSLATANGPIFTSTYDRGVMVFGDPLSWVNYDLYLVNGSAQNNDDINNRKDVGARIDANFAQLADIKNAVLHFGVSGSNGSIGYTNQSSSKGTLKAYTEGAGTSNYGKEFFSVSGLAAVDNGPDRTRWGLETALAYGPVKIQAEYIDANFQGKWKPKTTVLSYDNDITNWYADLNWLVTGESWADAYKSGVFGRIRPKHNFDDKGGWGALELGLRYSKFDASDFDGMLANVTTGAKAIYTGQANAWTAGATWIMNPNARIVLNYVHTEFDNPITINGKTDDKENAAILRAQFDF